MSNAEQQLQEAIDYIAEITNNEIGAGEHPISFIIATHRVLVMQKDEMLKALRLILPYIQTDGEKHIVQKAIEYAEFMRVKR